MLAREGDNGASLETIRLNRVENRHVDGKLWPLSWETPPPIAAPGPPHCLCPLRVAVARGFSLRPCRSSQFPRWKGGDKEETVAPHLHHMRKPIRRGPMSCIDPHLDEVRASSGPKGVYLGSAFSDRYPSRILVRTRRNGADGTRGGKLNHQGRGDDRPGHVDGHAIRSIG